MTNIDPYKLIDNLPSPPTLHDKLCEYLQKADFCKSYHVIANEIVDIVENHLPKENTNPSVYTMQWNKCIKMMKNRLR